METFRWVGLAAFAGVLAWAADQTHPGAGNARAEQIGAGSALVHRAYEQLAQNVRTVKDDRLRNITLDGLFNRTTCIAHRANLTIKGKRQIMQQLVRENLLAEAEGTAIEGGAMAGIFPPVLDDGSSCPHLPLSFEATPGSNFGSHHSFPGGLAVHEAFNQEGAMSLAAQYRAMYGSGLPGAIDQEVVIAAPVWHDWGKMLVFQWNADGTEFQELNFGGTGNSKTGAHHVISLAETMARGLPALLVITQASAHAPPTLDNGSKVVNWLRAAAILARIDPVAKGYLVKDREGELHIPDMRLEYQIGNLSDGDFVNSVPAAHLADGLLRKIASDFGYDPAEVSAYNNRFRNVVLSNLSAERIEIVFGSSGVAGVSAEIRNLKNRNITRP